MKTSILALVIILSCITMANAQQTGHKALKHIVLFGWKTGTDSSSLKKVTDAFIKLPLQIPSIKAFEWGTNNSPENLNQGLTYCFQLTFSSEKDRNDYLVDPAHKTFVAIASPYIDKVTVFDYWATEQK